MAVLVVLHDSAHPSQLLLRLGAGRCHLQSLWLWLQRFWRERNSPVDALHKCLPLQSRGELFLQFLSDYFHYKKEFPDGSKFQRDSGWLEYSNWRVVAANRLRESPQEHPHPFDLRSFGSLARSLSGLLHDLHDWRTHDTCWIYCKIFPIFNQIGSSLFCEKISENETGYRISCSSFKWTRRHAILICQDNISSWHRSV